MVTVEDDDGNATSAGPLLPQRTKIPSWSPRQQDFGKLAMPFGLSSFSKSWNGCRWWYLYLCPSC